jgi:hypothetical protein
MTTEDAEDAEAPNDLSQAIRDVLTQCLENGMKAPLIVCTASPNGRIMAMRVIPDCEPDILVEHVEAPGVALPLTIMVLDQDNVAARITVNAAGSKVWH